MTNLRTRLVAFVLPAAALSLSAFGLAAGSNAETPSEDPPMQCQITVSKDRFGYTYKGMIHADRTVQGSYELSISKRGGGTTNINQGGPFLVKAGRTETIGQASFGGMAPESVDARLLLHVDGKTYLCSTQSEI